MAKTRSHHAPGPARPTLYPSEHHNRRPRRPLVVVATVVIVVLLIAELVFIALTHR